MLGLYWFPAARDCSPRAPESAHQQRGESPRRTEHWLSVAEGHCVVERRGGGQPEANNQSITKGTNTVGSAGNGSTRRRDPCSLGMGGTNGLDRAHVDSPGNGDGRRKMV